MYLIILANYPKKMRSSGRKLESVPLRGEALIRMHVMSRGGNIFV